MHLWPDILLGFWLLLFSVILQRTGTPADIVCLGTIAALGFATRVDFAALPLFGAVYWIAQGADPVTVSAGVIGPTVAVAALLSVVNGRRHGIWAPDTTVLFNLRVAATELRHPQASTGALMRMTVKSHADRLGSRGPDTAAGAPLAPPCRRARLVPGLWFRRLITLTGQETFVRHTLIQMSAAGYAPIASRLVAQLIDTNLRLWFPVLCGAFVLYGRQMPAATVALVAVMIALQSLVQTRSRYRMAVLPVIAANVAAAAWGDGLAAANAQDIVMSGIVMALLICVPPRPEADAVP
ncbi:hypothetical protein [Breoghania sp. L-A4]|uniref:hypothetical protein n=1 Tax=Breoghania sp. L-A4 TaxID=2304600 RepID=UPI000E359BB6|nr:hypothetical protein [Breoghania sp. L-A4]AXS42017.1 hypothetical protein D1F64_20925 [Breoghania sp. L-A4]